MAFEDLRHDDRDRISRPFTLAAEIAFSGTHAAPHLGGKVPAAVLVGQSVAVISERTDSTVWVSGRPIGRMISILFADGTQRYSTHGLPLTKERTSGVFEDEMQGGGR